ncbi:class I SAM-dependent methyltransferase [Ferruginibacter paludis]|uniref:class I SAM-dependent methyltransferase n=1 Tax=Ferruginibacter paludis TaxID=1310417 RepID=UPI0025B30462|nr:class I SAM-dependent methyltransferase [Ferruginibacter paludis]MDN3657494.1 class I SAM-dependent methyltransferase [Ferruginibacter paludis]
MVNREFVYVEEDEQGFETLTTLSGSDNFNQWMYQSIKPFLKGRVLEIGSGIGNITQFMLRDGFRLTASDVRDTYCDLLDRRFRNLPIRPDIRKIDIVHPKFNDVYHDLLGKFDCVVALNIIEHVEDDQQALINCKKLLRENGNLIILVPAYRWLYNSFDTELKHFRRYTKSALEDIVLKAGLTRRKTSYFNFVGMWGWWWSGNILKKQLIPEKQMQLFNRLVPVFKIIDKLIVNKMGLSIITVAFNSS